MCGIAGYFGKGNKDVLEKMTRTLHHRGPDEEGFYVAENLGLGHRRLSIIDLKSGHQPMQEQGITLVFNGEIYNFKILREKLEAKGRQFKTNSDTEVIIKSYLEYGNACFEDFNGMFACAIWDEHKKQLILARDRIGKKPLYWGIFNNTLIFGSELKVLLSHPVCKKELDLSALNKYLTYEYVPTPHSIFKNIFKLEPASYLVYDGQEVKKNKFWEIEFKKENLSIEQATAKLDGKLNQATKSRLISDVPLGVFLSGGIDSSTVAYYAQKNSLQKIQTFSIGFTESSFDESNYARQVAEFLKTDHHEQILSAKDSLNLIPEIGGFLDEPLADASIVPTFLLSKFTREHVTVALGGDGGDELFCGYDTFKAEQLAKIYEKVPLIIRKKIIEKIALNLPTSFNNISFDFKAKKFIDGFYGEKKYQHQRWLGAFSKLQKQQLFKPEIWQELSKENEFNDIDNYLKNIPQNNYYNQLIYLYLRTYLMDDILVKVDRVSMLNSLEVRAPLLDYEVVNFINSLPVEMKIKNFKTKYIFKKLMEDKLPREIVNRKEKGFGMPLADWLTNELKPLALELLSEENINKQGLFNYEYIKNLLNEHFSRRADNRKLIWTLMVFMMWEEKWLNT